MTLQSNVALNVTSNYSLSGDLAPKVCNLLRTYTARLASGVAANQADLVYHDRRTLAASAIEDLDLTGVLLDPLTNAVMTFVRLKLALFIAASANVNDVLVTRPANGVPIFIAAGDGVAIKPNGVQLLFAPGDGYAITPATGDLITVANGGAGSAITYDVVLIGASA
jgi:hypothetical protein